MPDAVLRSPLPDSMTPVVDAIGVSAALSLVHVYAGTRLYVPQAENLGEEHPICRLLGRPLTLRLCQAVGGDYISVPVGRALLKAERDRQIVERADRGESQAEIARAYGVTERWVQDFLRSRGNGR